MSRSPEIPEFAEIERTYEGLTAYYRAFREGRYNLLMTIGRPGLCKSRYARHEIGDAASWVNGRNSPVCCYCDLYQVRDSKHIVVDDAEPLYQSKDGKYLLRQLTETERTKMLTWNTTTHILNHNKTPKWFRTGSKLCIICNRFVAVDELTEAMLDRGHVIYFDPSPLAVHLEVGRWLKPDNGGQIVYDYIGSVLQNVERPSVRLYVKAVERYQAGGDWQQLIEQACFDTVATVFDRLEKDEHYKTVEQKAKQFVIETSMSRSTYFNIKHRKAEQGQLKLDVPAVRLTGVAFEEAALEESSALADVLGPNNNTKEADVLSDSRTADSSSGEDGKGGDPSEHTTVQAAPKMPSAGFRPHFRSLSRRRTRT
jgi:hypothetical protein